MYRHELETEKENRFINRSLEILSRKDAEKELDLPLDKLVKEDLKNIRKC